MKTETKQHSVRFFHVELIGEMVMRVKESLSSASVASAVSVSSIKSPHVVDGREGVDLLRR
jgi:hypothetical protein